MLRSNAKEDYLAICVPAIREVAETRKPCSLPVPEAISAETARNYVYEARKRMALTDRIAVSYDRTHVHIRAVNDLFDEAFPEPGETREASAPAPRAEPRQDRVVLAVAERKRPGVAVITAKPNEAIVRACSSLLDCMALEAVEFLGTPVETVEAIVREAQLSCIVSKCQGGALLT